MIFTETQLRGAFVIDIEKKEDQRGFFARTFCEREFAEKGLETRFVQSSISHNTHKGTLRGMHYQAVPYEEVKVVRCTAGALYDVIVDLRPDSPTFKKHFGVELTAQNCRMLYIPKQFAHGFQTLQDHTAILYQMTQFYSPDSARGVRWNDPAFGINWPPVERIINERDQTYPEFK
jgi:dTDP-4-dehydrorhamnose 3,5-epimerase